MLERRDGVESLCLERIGNVSTKRRMDMIYSKALMMAQMCTAQLDAFEAEMTSSKGSNQTQVGRHISTAPCLYSNYSSHTKFIFHLHFRWVYLRMLPYIYVQLRAVFLCIPMFFH
eukprot:COSAG05_NODE_1067_length_5971_cov_450.254257_9_plen_115_part_00